jgi:maltose alpha-D-glucosyltransferase/alpha-amylase
LRKRFKAFGRGSLEFLQPENRRILAFLRRYQDETILVLANLSRLAQYTSLDLTGFAGRIPTEMFGQTEFPVIGETPYSVTLSPYAFYWFSLEAKKPEHIDLTTTPAEISVPTITLTGEWKNLYKRGKKPALEAALSGYIRQRRWFGGKARYISSSEIQDVITMPFGTSEASLILIQIDYSEGEPETYLVPITFALEERASQVINELSQAIIANLKMRSEGTDREGVIYDALVDPVFHDALLKAMARRRHFKGEKGEVAGSQTRAVFRKILGSAEGGLESTLLKGEQTNTSVVYGNRFKLKVFRRLEEGVSPELEIGRFLTEREPFPNSPPVAGTLEYLPQQEGEPVTLAILHGYVHNEGDGWQYTLDSLGRYFEQVLAHPGVEVPLPVGDSLLDISEESLPPIVQETIGSYLVSAQLLGQRTAELHLALASAMDDPDFVPEPFSVTYQRSLYHGMRGFAIQVLQLLRRRLRYLPDDVKVDAQRVLDMDNTIIGRFQDITRQKLTGMRIRCHGDYHLGQVLYTGRDFVIVDFEGEPALHLGERRIKRSPLRDVAGMLRSFEYAAYVGLRGLASMVLRSEDLPRLQEWAQAWCQWVSATFLKSYLQLMADTPILPQPREGMKVLLDAYLLYKAIYEISYELNNRPDWVGLPLQGVLKVLGVEGQPARTTPTKKRALTICPVCNTEFYVVGSSDGLPPVVNVTCPNCQTELVVDFKKARREAEEKLEGKVTPGKKPEAVQKAKGVIEGVGGKAKKEG